MAFIGERLQLDGRREFRGSGLFEFPEKVFIVWVWVMSRKRSTKVEMHDVQMRFVVIRAGQGRNKRDLGERISVFFDEASFCFVKSVIIQSWAGF